MEKDGPVILTLTKLLLHKSGCWYTRVYVGVGSLEIESLTLKVESLEVESLEVGSLEVRSLGVETFSLFHEPFAQPSMSLVYLYHDTAVHYTTCDFVQQYS